MVSEKPNLPKNSKGIDDDYVDIIDVMVFLWRAKVFVFVGVLLFSGVALAYVNSRKPPVYVTDLPIRLAAAGGITPDAIITKFNGFIAGSRVQEALLSRGVGFVGGKPPFRLMKGENSFALEVNSLQPDPSGERALNWAKTLYEVTQDSNKKSADEGSAAKIKAPSSDLEYKLAQLAGAQAAEEAPLRLELFSLEARLAQAAGSRPTPAAFFKGTSIGEDVLRLMAAAQSRITATEREKILSSYSDLIGKIKAVQAKYEWPLAELEKSLALAEGVLTSLGTGYPAAWVDEVEYKSSVMAGSHQRFENKTWLFLLLGAVLGAVFGLMSYASLSFFRANLSRLRATS
jgi:hypothetical protein